MAWTDLKAAVAAVIKTNGNQEITGGLLQSTLNSIIDQVGANASYKGVAIPSTAPGSPDGPVFYIASTQGTYANFGGFVLDGGFAVLSNISGSWTGTKFLKTEMDAKADHGYGTNPKTLKQVDDEVVQLAGENILGWAGAEAFSITDPIFDGAGNVTGGVITWPDGDVGSISNVEIGPYGVTSMRYNRSSGYVLLSVFYNNSTGDFKSQTITFNE